MATTVYVNGVTLTDAGAFNDFDDITYDAVIRPANSSFNVTGSGDEAAGLATMFAASTGKLIIMDRGKTYRSSTNLVQLEGSTLDMNGSALEFTGAGAIECLTLRSGCTVKNGSIRNAGSAPSGAGNFQCPISIGDYAIGTGYTNIRLSNLTLANNRDDGNMVSITGDSHDITVEDITLTGDATSGAGIVVHWGGAADPTTQTFHPHNVSIKNVRGGTFTRTDFEMIYIAAAVNVTVDNAYATAVDKSVVTVYAGDYGLYYASANIKALGFSGIRINNARCDATEQLTVNIDMQAPSAPGTPIYDVTGLLVDGCASRGSNTNSGFGVANAYGVELRNCKATAHLVGIATGANVERLRVNGGEYWANQQDGVSITNGVVAPKDCTIEGVYAHGNGLGGGNQAGIRFNSGSGHIARGNIVGETGETTQVFGIVMGPTTTNGVVENNHCAGAKSGGVAFSMGSSTTYVLKSFHGNTSVPIAGGGQKYDGPNPMVHFLACNRVDEEIKILFGTLRPTVGTFARGSQWFKTDIAAAGTPGEICITSGTYSTATDNTGDTDGSTGVITGMADTSDFLVGEFVTVSAGFASTGPHRIVALTASTMTVNANSNSAQANVTVATPDPVWKAMAAVAA